MDKAVGYYLGVLAGRYGIGDDLILTVRGILEDISVDGIVEDATDVTTALTHWDSRERDVS